MSGSAATIPQLFAVEAAKGTPTATGAAIMRAAYDAAEVPASADTELRRYYALLRPRYDLVRSRVAQGSA